MGVPGMIVVDSSGAAFLAVVLWVIATINFSLARVEGARLGAGWVALACGIFGSIQLLEALDLIAKFGQYLIAMVGMGWAGGSAWTSDSGSVIS